VLTAASLRFPDDGEVEFHLAESLGDLSRPAEAIVHYRQALFYNGNAGSRAPVYRSISLLRLAVLRLQARNPLRAKSYMERYMQLNPDRIWSRNVLAADIYLALGQFEDASREFGMIIAADKSKAVEAGVDQQKARMVKGTVDCYLGRSGCALLHDFKKNSILAQGLLQSHAGEHGLALRTLLPFLRENQQNLFARMAAYRALRASGSETVEDTIALAALCEQYGRNRDALDLLEEVRFKIRKEDLPESQRKFRERRIHRQMARLYGRLGQTHRALVEYREAWKDDGNEDADLRMEFARLLSTEEGRSEEALVTLGIPESIPGKILRASILESLDRCEEALQILDETGSEGETAAPFMRASCFERMGKRSEAADAARKVLASRSNDPVAMNFLAYMLALEGRDLGEASSLSQRTLAADPDNVAYQDTYGWILFQQKDYSRARYHLQFASRLSEEEGQPHAEVYYHVGEVYLALNDKSRALYYLDSARRRLAGKNKQSRMDEALYSKILDRLKDLES
jgi:tetratricopeptide (TPR) repeat protein